MLSLRQTVVMAVAIIGFAAAQTCTTLSLSAYSNTTGCATAQGYLQTLCTCTGSTWNTTNSSDVFCDWSNATFGGNCSGVAACLATYSAAINTFTSDSISDATCSNDFAALHSCQLALQASTSSLWNISGLYVSCASYADTVLAAVGNAACATTANKKTACANPLSVTVYFTFSGNWTAILSGSSRRARARAVSAAYTNVVNAISADIEAAIGYAPTSVTLQLTATGGCLATIVLPITSTAKSAFLAVYGGGGAAANALFVNTLFWFKAGGGTGTFAFVGAGTSSTAITPAPTPAPNTPAPTPAPSSASVATVANVLLAVLALVVLA